MPADPSLSTKPSARHGNGDSPYWCYNIEKMPRADWSLDYPKCRHSLEPEGSQDKRCPKDCKQKATQHDLVTFQRVYKEKGAAAAAEAIRETTRNEI